MSILQSAIARHIAAAGLCAGLAMTGAPAQADALKMGALPGHSLAANNTRDTPWCELGPAIGTPPDVVVHVFNSTNSPIPCTTEVSDKFDLKALAEKYGVPALMLNPARFWIADKVMFYKAGDVMDADGVKLTWAAEMTAAAAANITRAKPYEYVQITRDTLWYFEKDRPVFLMRQPDGKVWVMQVYSHNTDKTLSSANMAQLGDRLNLPEGWTYDVKVLSEPLLIEPARAEGVAHIIRDEFENTYQGCGFDASCSYIP